MPHCPTRGAKNAASSGSGERWEKQSCNDEDLSKSAEHGYYRAMRIARLGRRTCVPRFGIAFAFLFGQLSDHYIRAILKSYGPQTLSCGVLRPPEAAFKRRAIDKPIATCDNFSDEHHDEGHRAGTRSLDRDGFEGTAGSSRHQPGDQRACAQAHTGAQLQPEPVGACLGDRSEERRAGK